jgi:N-acetylglucosamine transport system substrate-binding protein
MLSKEGARGFTQLTKVMTVVKGAVEGMQISPGLTSATNMANAAGTNVFAYRWPDWYKKMDDECRSATNELMFSGGTADKFCDRMQKVADDVKNDSSIEKFKR